MAEPHIERCEHCGHTRVNLSGPPPGPTRPDPPDQEKLRKFLESEGWINEVEFSVGWPFNGVTLRFNESGRFVGYQPPRPLLDSSNG